MTPAINDTPINAREDWTHALFPAGAQGSRLETFPGISELFAAEGPQMPPGLALTGFMEGTGATVPLAVAALHAALNAADALRGAGQVHTLTVHDIDYEEMSLRRFNTIGPVERIETSGSVTVRQAVRYEWRQLKR